MTITVRTEKIPATDFGGSKITVRGAGRQRTFPFDYAADNAHVAAVERFVTEILEATLLNVTYLGDTRTGRGSRYRVTIA